MVGSQLPGLETGSAHVPKGGNAGTEEQLGRGLGMLSCPASAVFWAVILKCEVFNCGNDFS